MATVTLEEFVHAHYANGRGMALMTAGGGLVGVLLGGWFLSEASFESDYQMGGLFVLAMLVVTAIGAAWWRMRSDPTRSGVYQKLRETERVAWVTLARGMRPIWMFYRDDGEVIAVPSTTPGPARFATADLMALFRQTYPQAMLGSSEENSKAYFAVLEKRGASLKL